MPTARRRMGRARWAWLVAGLVLPLAAAYVAFDAKTREPPQIAPRHRPEALCFALATPPAFSPPIRVVPSAALVRGRFAPSTPAAFALREAMHFTEDMVLSESSKAVGDFQVAILWLRLPERESDGHWLVIAWMEEADLAACSFRFDGSSRSLSPQQIAWGERLLARILTPHYFRSGVIPDVRLSVIGGQTMPSFGPTGREKPPAGSAGS